MLLKVKKTKKLVLILAISILGAAIFLFGNNQSFASENPEDLINNPEQQPQYKQLDSIDIGTGDFQIAGSDDFYQSEIIEAEFNFNAIGFTWEQLVKNQYQIKIKTGSTSDQLSDWIDLTLMEEGRDGVEQYGTDLYFPEEMSLYFQYQIELITGDIIELNGFKAAYLDSTLGENFSTQDYQTQDNSSPYIISRAGWGCNESLMTWTPQYPNPRVINKIIVHHTAGPNNPSNPKATIRGIYQYHAVTWGWGDIGYNFLVDQHGNVYEGRKGGDSVIGAHALSYNGTSGGGDGSSLGISVLGTFSSVTPTSSARTAVEKITAWKAAYHSFNPKSLSLWKSKPTYNMAGHRNYNSTSCPGTAFYNQFSTMRNNAYNYSKNYEPGKATDLKIVSNQPNAIELEWTAPGAYWNYGTASRYQVFCAPFPITESNISNSNVVKVSGSPSPTAPGTIQRFSVEDLSPGAKYYFSMRAKNLSCWADIANNVTGVAKSKVNYLISETPARHDYLTAPGGDRYLWKTYNFDTTAAGTARIELAGYADSNGTGDDDDLKIILDGNDFDWGNNNALDGGSQGGKMRTIIIESDISSGSHTLELWADVTPEIHSLYVEGVDCQEKVFAVYPQEQSESNLNIELWKTYNFDVPSTGDYNIEVQAIIDSHGAGDDDDLKIIIDGDDYGWGGTEGFNGDTDKAREKTVTITKNLTTGSHTLELWADVNPILNVVEIYSTASLQEVSAMPASQLGVSSDLNTSSWRTKQFSCDDGPVKIKIKGYAQSNGSRDDDDLTVALDGINYPWGSNKGLNGNFDNSDSRTIVLNQYLKAGLHTLQVFVDETPNLQDVEIFTTTSTQNYLVEAYPNETSGSSLDVELWKDTDYNFTLSNAGTVRFEVTGSADKNSTDDDDLKLILVKTDSPTGNIDYNWNTNDALNGNSLKSASKKIIVEQFLRPGDYKLQIWGDVTPTLNSVLIQGVDSGGDLFNLSLNELTADLDVSLAKEYYFSATGSTNITINGFASLNQSDDDDLRVILDGQDYDWNTDDALDGVRDNGENYTITFNQNLSAGLHHLQIYADETPMIGSIVVTGTGAALNYRETDSFPNVTAPGGDRYHWSTEDQDITFTNAGVLVVTATADSNGSSDDDDLKIFVDSVDYGWVFNGDSLNGGVKTVYIPLNAGSHSLEFYADVTPTLYSVTAAETYSN